MSYRTKVLVVVCLIVVNHIISLPITFSKIHQQAQNHYYVCFHLTRAKFWIDQFICVSWDFFFHWSVLCTSVTYTDIVLLCNLFCSENYSVNDHIFHELFNIWNHNRPLNVCWLTHLKMLACLTLMESSCIVMYVFYWSPPPSPPPNLYAWFKLKWVKVIFIGLMK